MTDAQRNNCRCNKQHYIAVCPDCCYGQIFHKQNIKRKCPTPLDSCRYKYINPGVVKPTKRVTLYCCECNEETFEGGEHAYSICSDCYLKALRKTVLVKTR